MATARNLDRPCSALVLPPLPSSSGRHRRVLLSMPSSSSCTTGQDSEIVLSRPDSVLSRPGSVLGRTVLSNSGPTLGRGRPMLSSSDSVSNQSESALRRPMSVLARSDSALLHPDMVVNHLESIYSGFGESDSLTHKPAVNRPEAMPNRAYLPRRSLLSMPTYGSVDTQRAEPLHGPFLLSEELKSTSRTASAPSQAMKSGTSCTCAYCKLHMPCLGIMQVTHLWCADLICGSGSCSKIAHCTCAVGPSYV